MIDFDVVAYAMLGVSLSVSAVQVGRWLLSANPRAIINTGRWSLAGLAALTPLALLWLVISGRATLAMMFAAFILPAVVQGGLRWRTLFGPPSLRRANPSDGPRISAQTSCPDPRRCAIRSIRIWSGKPLSR